MPNFAAFLAPLVLLLPLPVAEDSAAPDLADHNTDLTPEPPETMPEAPAEWLMIEGANGMPAQYQVRIEQRVVIRVSPRRPAVRENLNAELPRRSRPARLVERKIGKCVKMSAIAGVQSTRDNRLLLYMRSNKTIAANLEKSCSVRDFYSGFYVEPSDDGNLCINRDKLQSRTGVKCKLSRLRELVPEQI